MNTTTKIYYNSTDKPMNVLGVDIIPPHEHVSITAEFQPPVQLQNYPGLEDITETGFPDELVGKQPVKTDTTPSLESNLEVEKTEGNQNG